MDPQIRAGKPTIKGTQIEVSEVLESLHSGDTEEQIIKRFPALITSDIQACIEFDEQERFIAAIREGEEDIRAGRHRPVEEVFAEIRERYGL